MDNQTTWSKDEFKGYLLLYTAQSDYVEAAEEKALILSKVDQSVYDKMHQEIDKDNDYQRAQKIMSTIERLGYSDAEKNDLKKEIVALIMVDGKADILEKNMMMSLTKLIG